MAYSPNQIFAALTAQGIPAADAATLTQISGAESGFGAKTVSSVNSNGSIDYGVFQINNAAHPALGGSALATAPLDQQAAAAAQVYNAQGLGAWSTYTSGAYQNFAGPTGSAATIAAGPTDASSGLNAGSSASGSGGGLDVGSAAGTAGVAALDAAGMMVGIPGLGDFLGGLFGFGGSSSSASGGSSWYVRAGVILLGIVIIVVGLVGLMWDHGGQQVAMTAAKVLAA